MGNAKRIMVVAVLGLGLMALGLAAGELSGPEKTFEYAWKVLDANYALFQAKRIDWQALYHVYRPQVTPATTDDELFAILSRLLGHLNDNHVRLMSRTPERYFCAGFLNDLYAAAGPAAFRAMMQQRPAPTRYFKAPLKETADGVFAYGWLSDEIGYFHFNGFEGLESSAAAIDQIIKELAVAKAIVVDVRHNGGGDDRVGKLLADRFADRKRLYMTTRERHGAAYGDFDPPKHFFVEPAGPAQFTKTVILLTSRLSVSAAENFTLAMRVLPHVTVIGDFTSGCFADNYALRLPNGWNLSLSKNLFQDWAGFCWEGIGVPPDLKVHTPYPAPPGESDPPLDTALALLRSGKLQLQVEDGSLKTTRSLVRELAQDIETTGVEPALKKIAEKKAAGLAPDAYLDFYELLALGQALSEKGQAAAGDQVLALAATWFPNVTEGWEAGAMAALKANRKAEAAQLFARAAEVHRKLDTPFSRQFADYLGSVLLSDLLQDGLPGLSRGFAQLRRENPDQANEGLLNTLGYRLWGAGLKTEAVQVLKQNVEIFPDYANGYDSLGEVSLQLGDKAAAIAYYQKALTLNPKMPSAIAALKALTGEQGQAKEK